MDKKEFVHNRTTVKRLVERLQRLPDECVVIFVADGIEASLGEIKPGTYDDDTLEPTEVSIDLLGHKSAGANSSG